MVYKMCRSMELRFLALFGLIALGFAQQQQQQQPAQFRQNQQEPQFQPPPLLPEGRQATFSNFQQPAGQGQVQFPQQNNNFNQPQQNNFIQPQNNFIQPQQPQQNFQQRPQVQQQAQPNFNDFADFNKRQQAQETLPTLPPVFIPPNNPIGPAPQLQSPIRNLFRQPESNSFSLSGIFNRFLNLFNLNSN